MAVTAVTEELWQAHRVEGDRSARERLILRYAPLVKHVVGRISIVLPPVLDMDDILSSGMVGLIKAVENFDWSRGVPFEQYAITCIKGAILDQMRSLDLLSRSVRQKAREAQSAMVKLQAGLGRAPTDEEVAEQLGLDVAKYRRLLTEIGLVVVSLDSELGADDDGDMPTLLSTVVDVNSPDPVSLAEKRELVDALAEAVSQLAERERLLLALYYKEELTMREISKVLGVSESRICQLHTRAILKLKAQLRLWHHHGEPRWGFGAAQGRRR